jgi:hypothetical protein
VTGLSGDLDRGRSSCKKLLNELRLLGLPEDSVSIVLESIETNDELLERTPLSCRQLLMMGM